ncbi:MAG: hypothetical protein Q8R82_07655 [Hyphomonadaceae bacterium]|nr:hypothetical protein [Hyphomonadaceae bacterium]
MSLRWKIVIAALALGLSAFAVFGDAFFLGLGLPSGSGRIVIAAALLCAGVVWFIWSSASVRRTAKDVADRRPKD